MTAEELAIDDRAKKAYDTYNFILEIDAPAYGALSDRERSAWRGAVLAFLKPSIAVGIDDAQKRFLAQMAATIAGPLASGYIAVEGGYSNGGIATDSVDIAREILRYVDKA